MSLNCLTCQVLQRTNSYNDGDCGQVNHQKPHFRPEITCCLRNWSGNLSPPPFRSGSLMPPAKKKLLMKSSHRRLNSTGTLSFETDVEPRLVRSSGMRRDWSFEELREETRKRKG
ncbi:hypothetical protein SLEP1_g9074 [Rubroshorea leprosula]|uniref:Uncharacterized protein n=1 Tax=Rubroshorea leprosula TaxID=152421 RepID=A0AAV5I3R1_9ROSI|nr:hypothetical protein SLEP1_g9074 [Rubroshorea leprosula]